MSDKLQIPGPHEHQDFSELDITIVMGWAVCMLMCIALFLVFRDRRPEPAPPQPNDPVKARQAQLSDRVDLQHNDWDRVDFADDDAVAVFRHGPREAAEAACRDRRESLTSASLTHAVHLELLKAVDRRAEHAPWTCLADVYFNKEMAADLELFDELSGFWAEMQRFEASPAIVESVLEDFRRTRDRPEHPAFYSWLRLCAVHPGYAAGDACQKLAYQLTPAQGGDILAMVDEHFDRRDPRVLRADMAVISAGLGRLARAGQPDAWRIDDTEAVDDYDALLRVGATFVLCRLVHSPHEDVARPAALQIARAATVSARPTDEHLLTRWRESCLLAFGGGAEEATASERAAVQQDDEHGSARLDQAAALAVWDGDADSAPDYTLSWAVERGDCPTYEDRPAWYCGVELWQGGDQQLDLALMGFFTETRDVEWAQR